MTNSTTQAFYDHEMNELNHGMVLFAALGAMHAAKITYKL